jgi:MinD-like ATPase involved in chromosome partitioning or flagellar assembly
MILIISLQPKEGNTATAVNIALILAWNGQPVLLIDADSRNGRCHRSLGLENGRGLTDGLIGSKNAPDSIKKTSIAKLSLLSRGHTPPVPAQLLGSETMQHLLALGGQSHLIHYIHYLGYNGADRKCIAQNRLVCHSCGQKYRAPFYSKKYPHTSIG